MASDVPVGTYLEDEEEDLSYMENQDSSGYLL